MGSVKIRTSVQHRWGRTEHTSVGVIEWDNEGIAEVDEKFIEEYVPFDSSCEVVKGAPTPEVKPKPTPVVEKKRTEEPKIKPKKVSKSSGLSKKGK